MTADGVMGRVRGSRRDPRKDEYGKISRRCRRHNWKDCHLERFWWRWRVWRWGQVLYLAQGRGGGSALTRTNWSIRMVALGELSGDSLARFRAERDSFYLGQEGSEKGLRRMDVWRCSVSPWARLKLSDLAKVVAQKAATSASKGVVISEGSETTSGKRALDDGSKGKQVAQSPEPKKARIDTGASGAPARPVPLLQERGVILGSSLAIRSRDFAECALNQKAVAESVRDGKWISELEKSQSLTQGRIIAAFKESDDFLEAVRGSASSYFGDGFDFCKRQLAHQYPDLGVDLEDVEMDHEFLAKEEAEAEQRAAEDGAAGAEGCCSVFKLHLAINRSAVPFMFSKTNLGGEESEQSLPSWISDHLGAKSYIDETSQSPSSPPTNSPKMDTSSLTKEGNAMSQAELDKLGSTYSFPPGIRLRIPGDGETILSARQGEVAFYEAAFLAGLRLPLHPTIRKILIHYKICPAQLLSPNAWRSVICSLVIWRHFKRHMSCDEFRCLYSLSPLPDSGWYYFKARPEKNLLRGSPSNVKGWKTRFFFASGDEWEFLLGMTTSDSTPRVPRSWGMPAAINCRLCPRLTPRGRKAIFGKIEPRGYFEVSKVLGSRTFNKHFAVGCTALSTSGGDNTTSGDEGEFVTREDSVEYLGVIRRDIGGAIRRALPGIPDETLLRWLGGKVKDPFTNLLSGTSGSSSDSGSVSISDSELPPELRSDAMSARGKAKAEEGNEDDSQASHLRSHSNPTEGRSMLEGVLLKTGTSSPGGDMGSESMSDASVARRLLTGVIPASDKKVVDQLSENELVAKSFHALGQVVVFASSLAIRSQEHLHDIDFHMARADSAELELVKAQKRAVKAENRLAELSERRINARLRAVIDSAATYFSEGFEFCKRQLLHQFPNLGVDVANMAMDPSFAEEEEARKEGEDPVAGVAPDV
ncbi:hypothetical protein Acr_11g0008840 [Actinidia rufa]|uniref:Transposase (putative) gypsy type domain-containing protein n=1 Tax=Actinidia rufa TaxID=165716 RepID=A0A7J0FD57_9ERIC|nr:hypothetical protein Acr_11g0008840 [Actinidia rufa]